MKIKLPLFFISILLLCEESNAQQCSSGGCTTTGSEYPSSGAPYTPTSSWQTFSFMNAGNWTRFNVISGNTYEWSYCESKGGVSTAWDAQLTLSNNNTPAVPICFSTDQCGNNGDAPYISWTATFTGIARILSTAYVSGIGCQTNSCSCYNKLAYRMVASAGYNLTVTVHNVGGALINNAGVSLYNSSWGLLQTLSTNASGQVTFTGLANAPYNYEVYFTPSGTNPPISPNTEFWGSKAVTISGSNLSSSFTRNQPYISSPIAFSPSTLNTGQQTTGGFTVLNPLPYSTNSYIRIWVDRNQASTWDYTNQNNPQSISSGGTYPFSFNVTPANPGSHFKYAFVYSLVNGNYIITDQYAWSSAFTANSPCTTPAIPASALVTQIGQTSANFSWAPGNPVGSPTVTYYWVVGTSQSVTYGNGVAQGTTTGTSASSTSLICNTTYYLRVFAQTSCDGSSSGYKNSSSFTTANCVSAGIYGIDVNDKGAISWSLVNSSTNGHFAYAKATEGLNFNDAAFNTYMPNAINAGIVMGAYHFARPDLNPSSAVAEADHFLDIAGSYIGIGYLPPALDIDQAPISNYLNSHTIIQLAQWLNIWAERVHSMKGIWPVLYGDRCNAAGPLFPHYPGIINSNIKLWIADYTNAAGSPDNFPGCNWVGWPWVFHQYSETGSISGITGNVDLDIFNGNLIAFDDLINTTPTFPDLIITAGTQSVSSSTVSAGSSITAYASEDNLGNYDAASGTEVGLWLSSTSPLNTSTATYLGAITGFPNIAQGNNSIIKNKTVNIPCGIIAGSYYLFFWADGGSCSPGSNCSTCDGVLHESDDCNNFASVVINVTTSPPGAVAVSGGGTFCNSAILSASGGSGGTIYWQGTTSNGTSTITASNNQTVNSSGTYYFRAYNGCVWGTQGSATVTINNIPPPASITASGTTNFCSGGHVTLNANTGPFSYQWRKNGIDISAATSSSYFDTESGNFNVKVMSNTGCSAFSNTITVNVWGETNVCPEPVLGFATVNITSTGAKVKWKTRVCAEGYYVSYRNPSVTTVWTSKAVNTNTGYKNLFGLTPSTTYQWKVRSRCDMANNINSAYSTIQTFTTPALRIDEETEELASDLKVMPNPTSGKFILEFVSGENQSNSVIKIYNSLGQSVFQKAVEIKKAENQIEIDLTKFPSGIYLLNLKTENRILKETILKE